MYMTSTHTQKEQIETAPPFLTQPTGTSHIAAITSTKLRIVGRGITGLSMRMSTNIIPGVPADKTVD
jgi:hypothetical protein